MLCFSLTAYFPWSWLGEIWSDVGIIGGLVGDQGYLRQQIRQKTIQALVGGNCRQMFRFFSPIFHCEFVLPHLEANTFSTYHFPSHDPNLEGCRGNREQNDIQRQKSPKTWAEYNHENMQDVAATQNAERKE